MSSVQGFPGIGRLGRRRALGWSFELAALSVATSLVLVSALAAAAMPTFAVATDSAVGKYALALPGGQNLLKDFWGKYLTVYADSNGSLAIAVPNGDPTQPGAWGAPATSDAPAVP